MFKIFLILFVGFVLLGGGCVWKKKTSEQAAPPVADQPFSSSVTTESEVLSAPNVKPSAAPVGDQNGKAPKITVSVIRTVMISDFSYSPAEIRINNGDKVIWKHDDDAPHDVVSDGNFKSSILARGGQFSFTFNQAGEYNYYCSIHPSMTAKVIVK